MTTEEVIDLLTNCGAEIEARGLGYAAASDLRSAYRDAARIVFDLRDEITELEEK